MDEHKGDLPANRFTYLRAGLWDLVLELVLLLALEGDECTLLQG